MPGIAFGRGGVAASVIRSGPDIGSVEWLRTSGVRIGIVLALGIVVSWVGSIAVKRLRRRLNRRFLPFPAGGPPAEDENDARGL
jgi:drug/metabolite transporter (DMT)-like permease